MNGSHDRAVIASAKIRERKPVGSAWGWGPMRTE